MCTTYCMCTTHGMCMYVYYSPKPPATTNLSLTNPIAKSPRLVGIGLHTVHSSVKKTFRKHNH